MDKILASLCDHTLASKHLFSMPLLPEKLEKRKPEREDTTTKNGVCADLKGSSA
jgi:hypothetical protein